MHYAINQYCIKSSVIVKLNILSTRSISLLSNVTHTDEFRYYIGINSLSNIQLFNVF